MGANTLPDTREARAIDAWAGAASHLLVPATGGQPTSLRTRPAVLTPALDMLVAWLTTSSAHLVGR